MTVASFVALAAVLTAPLDAQTHLVVVTGLSGEPGHTTAFRIYAGALLDAATRFGIPDSNIAYLAEDSTARVSGKSTKDQIAGTLRAVASRAEPGALICVVFIGHGSGDGAQSRFNLPGPDLTAADLSSLLWAFPTQRIAIVNTSSASGDWVAALSGDRRIVITATRSSSERNETQFPRLFVGGLTSDGADTDKDGRVSLFEAFDYARREVARSYESEKRLLTEHAMLDDNGDGKGSTAPDPQTGDGAVAARVYLQSSQPGPAADPALAPLIVTRDSLEGLVTDWRARRAQVDSTRYETELERLLLELARVGRLIREKGGK